MPAAIVERGAQAPRCFGRPAASLHARPARIRSRRWPAPGRAACRRSRAARPRCCDCRRAARSGRAAASAWPPVRGAPALVDEAGHAAACFLRHPRRPGGGGMIGAPPLLEAIDLSKQFTLSHRRLFARDRRGAAGRRRRVPGGLPRRDPGSGRRIRLRQVDARPLPGPPLRHHGGRLRFEGVDIARSRPAPSSARSAAGCRWCSRIPLPRSIRAAGSAT